MAEWDTWSLGEGKVEWRAPEALAQGLPGGSDEEEWGGAAPMQKEEREMQV